MVWVALGAAGGIVAYRKGQQWIDEARARGVVGSLQAASGSAAGLAEGTRNLVQRALAPTPQPVEAPAVARPSGTAAARALAEARRAGSPAATSPATTDRSGRESS